MQCVLSAAVSSNNADTFQTFWFPASVVANVIMEAENGTLDLTSSDYDSYQISTIYEGMDQFVIRKTGANGFEADKLMLNNSTAYNYLLNKDLRYNLFDKVDIYTFYRNDNGTIE